jgi:hypothetical protein
MGTAANLLVVTMTMGIPSQVGMTSVTGSACSGMRAQKKRPMAAFLLLARRIREVGR